MEAYVWASTCPQLGIAISTRMFGCGADAKMDAQEAIGDACPIEWTGDSVDKHGVASEWVGEFTDTNGSKGTVAVRLVKVRL